MVYNRSTLLLLRTDVNTTITTTVALYLEHYKNLLKLLDGEDKVTL